MLKIIKKSGSRNWITGVLLLTFVFLSAYCCCFLTKTHAQEASMPACHQKHQKQDADKKDDCCGKKLMDIVKIDQNILKQVQILVNFDLASISSYLNISFESKDYLQFASSPPDDIPLYLKHANLRL